MTRQRFIIDSIAGEWTMWADINLICTVLLFQLADMIVILWEILAKPNKALKLIPLLLEKYERAQKAE